MSSPEVPDEDIGRLVRIGAPGSQAEVTEWGRRLGSALWQIIDFEMDTPTANGIISETDDDDGFDVAYTGEVAIGPRTTAFLEFRGIPSLRWYAAWREWLPRIHSAALIIESFARVLPHDDDASARSTLIIKPEDPAYDNPGHNRETPHIVSTTFAEDTPLPIPDVETTIKILGKVAGQYA